MQHDLGGWDLCRACQILGMGYVAGYIDRDEMMYECIQVAEQMRKLYSSWEELYQSYLFGYGLWRTDPKDEKEAAADIAARREAAEVVLRDIDGPLSLDWNMPL